MCANLLPARTCPKQLRRDGAHSKLKMVSLLWHLLRLWAPALLCAAPRSGLFVPGPPRHSFRWWSEATVVATHGGLLAMYFTSAAAFAPAIHVQRWVLHTRTRLATTLPASRSSTTNDSHFPH